MSHLERLRLLVEQMDALGVTIDELAAQAALMGRQTPSVRPPVPTVAEFVETAGHGYAQMTLDTYMSYWRIAIELHGDDPISVLDYGACDRIVEVAFERARQRFPDRACRSTRENATGALRALLAKAVRAGHLSSNPALALAKPRRHSNSRRALTEAEMDQVWQTLIRVTRDPGLHLLLVRFHLESGARREGACNLKLADLDRNRCTIWLDEKGGKVREQPISPSLMTELIQHAADRGATSESDTVLRTRRHQPITRRTYNHVFEVLQRELAWTHTPVTAHVLRHTAITRVERAASYAVAQAFAGHAPSHGGVTGSYIKATVEEVAAAVALLTGEPHPLVPQDIE